MSGAKVIWLALLIPMHAWARYPDALPAEVEAQRALAAAPIVMAARENSDRVSARGAQVRAGPYEWSVGTSQQRRTDPSGITYSEQLYEISRGFRWPGKAGLDRSLGAQAAVVGELSFADAWHEAGRSLLAGWFDWLRSVRAARVVKTQVDVLREQVSSVEARIRAGDARTLDLSLAQTDLQRALVTVSTSELRASEAELRLRSAFPELQLTSPDATAEPIALVGPDEEWVQRILADNHEIGLAEATYEEAQLTAERARRDRIPDPTLALRYSDNFDGNRRVVGLNVSIPIGGAARSAASRASRAEARMAEQRARETRLRVEADAQRAVLAARASYGQWTRLRDVATQARQNAEKLQHGYTLGEFTITDVLLARRQALDAELEAAMAQLDALETMGRLQLDAHQIWTQPGEAPLHQP